MKMKIVRDDSVLHVVDSPRILAFIGFAAGVALFGARLFHDWAAIQQHGPTMGHMFALMFGLIVGVSCWSWRDFQFDKSARKLTWQRRRLMWARGGEVPFEDITDAALEPKKLFLATGRGNTSQLVLRTTQGAIPICDSFSSKTQKHCEEVAARIREVLRNPRA